MHTVSVFNSSSVLSP